MFKELAQLLGAKQDAGSLNILIALTTDAQLSVTVLPVQQSAKTNSVLSRPFNLVGTPDELDAQFAELIQKYGQSRASLVEQMEAETLILQSAEKESADKATKKLAGKSAAANAAKSNPKSASVSSDDDDLDQDDESGGVSAQESPAGASSGTSVASSESSSPAGDLPVLFGPG